MYEVAVKVVTAKDLRAFNEKYEQDKTMFPCFYICVNREYIASDVKREAFLKSIGYDIITL